MHGAAMQARRLLGVALAVLATAPLYRLLGPETGLAGEATVSQSDLTAALLWTGFVLVLLPAVVLARVLRPETLEARLRRVGIALTGPRPGPFAIGAALLAGLLTLLFGLLALEGKPNLIDGISQLLHARYIAAGRLAGPVLPEGGFWHIQNTLVTENGWVSQYPPGFVLLLALGFRLGAVWAVGPVLAAIAVFFTALAAERLLPEDRATARLGALLAAASPFLIGLAGAYMNHVAAAALGAMALYFALRARDAGTGWAAAAGAALGALFATRPLSALVVGALVGFGVWTGGAERGAHRIRRWLARAGAAGAGALPFLAALGAYNAHFFGSPGRFGYSVAHGATTALGFHLDPWGNRYGPLEALAYTSSDLLALSLNLLETPFPTVAMVGVYLAVAPRLSRGERLIVGWALLPVLANVFYWHHGLFMGPRMLNEAAPAWALLVTVAAVGVVRAMSAGVRLLGGRYSPRVALAGALIVAGVVGLGWLGPQRLIGYGGERVARLNPPVPAPSGPSLVFVHGGWSARIAMDLAARGMRLDSLETLLRQNGTCRAMAYAEARARRDAGTPGTSLPALDFEPRAHGFPPRHEISPGNAIRVEPGETVTPECIRQIRSDRHGIVDVSPLVWQGDLPGLPARGPMYVRDMGPDANARLIRAHPERRPMMLLVAASDADPVLVDYEQGMGLIWTDGTPQEAN